MPHAFKALGLLALSSLAVSFGMAQSGPKDMISLPIKTVDAKTIQLVSKEGKLYDFTFDSHTTFCKGKNKVWDSTYLRALAKDKDKKVTLKLSEDFKHILVIWNEAPSTPADGSAALDFPPMCK
jgi:hypothetical protein